MLLRSIIGDEQSNKILIKFSKFLTLLSVSTTFKAYHTLHNQFVLIYDGFEDIDDVTSLVSRMQNELKNFFTIGKDEFYLYITASVGVAVYPDHTTRISLLDHAFQALVSAKKSGFGRYEIYYDESSQKTFDEFLLFNRMHKAIELGEFEVFYQPIIASKSRDVVGAEALVRWHHPEYGLIMPDNFIPMLEKTGSIIALGRHIFEEVLKQLKRWQIFDFKEVSVSINVAPIELEHGGFVEYVSIKLDEYNINPQRIKFEITESYAMRNEGRAKNEIAALKKLGCFIVLDDFGTGYTSFSYLKKISADIIKIDKTMVDHILDEKEDQRILKAMIELAHTLNMKVIVEGVESASVFQLVSSFGCDYVQGYYISKPMPVLEFQKLLRE